MQSTREFFIQTLGIEAWLAMVLAIGIVVDDAIIAGENIYENLAKGKSRMEAAIEGARQVKIPLTFSILTNIVAFLPLMFIEGGMGKVMMAIPAVVILCFAISWDRFEKEISRRSLLFRFGYGQWTAHLVRTIHICASDVGFGSLTVAKALRAGVRDGDTVPEHRAVEVEFEIDDLRLRLGRRG